MGIFAEEIILDDSMRDLLAQQGFQYLKIPRRVGIDRIKVVLDIEKIDWKKLKRAIESEKELGLKMTKVTAVAKPEDALRICVGEELNNWVSSITIQLYHNRLSIRRGKFGNKDECAFDVCIAPLAGFEYLGNISNNSCEEEKAYIKRLMREITENYGIYFVEGYAGIRHMEINVTFKPKHRMDNLVKILGPYQVALDRFAHSDYRENSENNALFNREVMWKETLRGMRVTSLVSKSKTRGVIIYDKRKETILSYNDKNKDEKRKIQELSVLCRIEFMLHRRETIEVLCNRKSNLFELTQNDIENAFRRLATNLLKEPIEEYYREVDETVAKYFEHIDVKMDRKWREHCLNRIKEMVRGASMGAYNITEEELRQYTAHMNAKTVVANAKRTADLTIKVFKESGDKIIWVTKKEKDYKELVEWLCNIQSEEEQEIYVLYQ